MNFANVFDQKRLDGACELAQSPSVAIEIQANFVEQFGRRVHDLSNSPISHHFFPWPR